LSLGSPDSNKKSLADWVVAIEGAAQRDCTGLRMKRRRFLFWISLGLFSLAEKLRADGLDELAAATMNAAEPATTSARPATPVHWRADHNATWQWYERENFVDGRWMRTGITTPIHKKTGQPYTEKKGYLDDNLVPADMRVWEQEGNDNFATTANAEPGERQPDATRRARHGRPPSKWLRSLHADEIRIWLKTIDVPEAGVSGMTYWIHLTRDHFFDAGRIDGLTEDEQAKLHAAAHHGY
jgi:hypothetical protein